MSSAAGVFAHLVDVDGDVDGDVDEVAERQAGDQSVGAVPHGLVEVDDPQQRGVPHHPHREDQAGQDRVHVLEQALDVRPPQTRRQRPRSHRPVPRETGRSGVRGHAVRPRSDTDGRWVIGELEATG